MTTIRGRMLVSLLAGVALVLVASGGTVYFVARITLRSQLRRNVVDRARTFAALVGEDEEGLALDYEGSLAPESLGVWLRVTDDAGEIVAASPAWPLTQAPRDAPEDEPASTSVRLSTGAPAIWAGVRTTARRDDPDEEPDTPPLTGPEREVLVEVLASTSSAARAEGAVLLALASGALLACLGVSISVRRIVRQGLLPVSDLAHDVDALDASRPDESLPPRERPEELAPIAGAIESLLERLHAAMERERRFTDAAAHELRTPIAELALLADVADRYPDTDRVRACVRDARAIARELETLLDALLAAARGVDALDSGPSERVPVLAEARAVLDSLAQRCAERSLRARLEGDESASWTGPRGAVRAIVRNLIDNAVEHSAPGGDVIVRVSDTNAGANLTVENPPAALAPEDVPRIFEPFWRSERSRSDRRHRGLGLAVVASLAKGLGLTHSASLLNDGHLRVTIAPRAEHPARTTGSSTPG